MSTEEPRPATVLVVDDEPTIAEVVARYLERAGHATRVASDGPTALAALAGDDVDLVILDVMLPGLSGLEVLRHLRERPAPAPGVIMLTARGEEDDRIVGLRAGADDYVVKPFSPAELVARAEAVLRRTDTERGAISLVFGALEIDQAGRRALLHGTELPLTQREFELLVFLARHPGRAFTRDELMDRVWRFSFYTDTSTVTVHVRRLRAKLDADPAAAGLIETVWGVGYRFAAR